MLKTPLFAPFVVSLVALAVPHLLAIHFAWYWSYWYADVIVHFFGGLFVGFAGLWLFFFSPLATHIKNFEWTPERALAVAVVAGIVVGGLWEVFEFSTNMFVAENPFPDTWYDLWDDLAGALTAFSISAVLLRQRQKTDSVSQ